MTSEQAAWVGRGRARSWAWLSLKAEVGVRREEQGGTPEVREGLRQGSEVPHVHLPRTLIGDVCVLEDMTVHLPIIEIRIVECRGGGLRL